jgi:tRNA 2-thiocytidine biosynthesis protein TtcA
MLSTAERITKLAGKAIAEFDMIRAGDRIAVGLSGGKDSLALLHALRALQARAPIDFTLTAFTIQQGKFLGPLDGLRSHLAELGVTWEVAEDQPSLRLVNEGVEHGCDICSRYRRRAVYETARRLQCNVIAFGHTADDFAEAMVRNLIYTGRVKPLPPVVMSSKNEFRLIRPLIYVKEDWIRERSTAALFPIVPCACSLKETTRQSIRGFFRQISADNPHIYGNIIAAGVRTWQKNVLTTEAPASANNFTKVNAEDAKDAEENG